MELFDASLFTGLDVTDRSFLNNHVEVQTFIKDSFIFNKGDQADMLYVLKSGLLKMTQFRSGTTKEEIVCLIDIGDQFCLAPLLEEATHHMSAIAIEKCEVYVLKRADIMNLIDQSHDFSRRVIKVLAKKECDLCEEVCDLSLNTTKERLAKYLLKQFEKKGNAEPFQIPLSQSDLAGFLGTVRESVSRDLAAFKKAQLIQVEQGNIKVLDYDGLKRMAERG
ncbi:MAG: Crp/Fnr family transcriptional regulator [Candidatus Gracilibacteria bacterium]|nr:Crp/Fnr family transcriptional regulator [Candidatus Gracilibacteria bacterium]